MIEQTDSSAESQSGSGKIAVFRRGWMAFRLRVLKPAFVKSYRLCYITGAHTIRFSQYMNRWLQRVCQPALQGISRVADRLLFRHLRALAAEGRRIREGFRMAGPSVRAAAHRRPFFGVLQALRLPWLAVRRHRKAVVSLGNLLAPAAAAFLLIMTLQYWGSTTFALELEYDGQALGYITDESVFDNAATMAEGRVIDSNHAFAVERSPKLTLTMVPENALLDESAVCDKILKKSVDAIAQVSGLYIDGKFEAAVLSRETLEEQLNQILSSYCDGSTDEKAEFIPRVEIVDGLYPVSAVSTNEALYERLVTRGEDGRPYLGVQVRRREVYTESIPYTSSTVQDTGKYIGYTGTKVEGKDGERLITADVIYVDGVEQSREILSSVVQKEAVNEVIAVGAYQVNPTASRGVATGKFMWPLPACRTVWSPFGYRDGKLHAGVDISGNGVYGKEVLAADGGRVVGVNAEGYGGGYGYYVLIDHGNGYTTMYAHCSAILVNVGDRVTQGQLIARVGDTGNSQGAHLHFEIRYNGVAQNPVPYVK